MSYRISHFRGVLVVHQEQPATKKKKGKGSARGNVKGFASKSRRKLLVLMNKLEPIGTSFFITLTYGKSWPKDRKAWKVALNRVLCSLRYHYPKLSCIWKQEFQKRGAPHFHLMLFLTDEERHERFAQRELYGRVWKAWFNAIGRPSLKRLDKCVWVEPVLDLKKSGFYLALYQSKDEYTPRGVETGRMWGIFGRAHLPVGEYEKRTMLPARQTLFRRIVRKWLEACDIRRGNFLAWLRNPHGSFTVFLALSEQLRLMNFMECEKVSGVGVSVLGRPLEEPFLPWFFGERSAGRSVATLSRGLVSRSLPFSDLAT